MFQTLKRFCTYHLRATHPDRLLYAITLVAVATLVIAIIIRMTGIRQISIAYVIPVLIAAIRWGVLEAATAAFMAVGASAFFFYAPIYDFRVFDPLQIVDLILFLLVALVTGHFATRLRVEAERSNRRERENGALYAFARRLAAARDATGIYDAIQQHLSLLVGRSVMLFGPATTEEEVVQRCAAAPAHVRNRVIAALRKDAGPDPGIVLDDPDQTWLVRALSPQSPDFGVIAVDLGPRDRQHGETIVTDIDTALLDAAATLQRLGLSHAISEARSRTDAERLRDALLGSVSHELRTPLASILGATTTLAGSSSIQSDSRLSGLANVVREEAERLNHDIQNLLDATRISSDGVHPKFEWSEPADIVNAALDHRRARLNDRTVNVRVAPDLPLVYVDSVLIEQALGQLLDNAAKYSPPGAPIEVEAQRVNDSVTITVTDRGAGFSASEKARAGERFFRSERHVSSIAGAGLGLWIARSFVSANAGHLDIVSGGAGTGSSVLIRLPVGRDAGEAQAPAAWSGADA